MRKQNGHDKGGVFIPRMEMSYEQRMENVERLVAIGRAYQRHADALRAETEMLVERET